MKKERWKMMKVWSCTAMVLILGATASAQQTPASASLEENFRTPPQAALPRVWWHWMSGNVTQPGITADLEWMHRTKIGGFQMFDGDLGVAQYLEHPVIWMTPDWKAAFHHAAAEADRLHLEMSMAASGGWSETAGPWVKPSEAMKKVVWSETVVHGGQRFHAALASPPRVNGPFQGLGIIDVPNVPMVGGEPGIPRAKQEAQPPDPTFYADTVVLAYPLPAALEEARKQLATLTASDASLNVAAISDADDRTSGRLNFAEGKDEAWIQWDFHTPAPARTFTLQMAPGATRQTQGLPTGELAWSNDGKIWTKLLSLPGTPQYIALMGSRTFSFAPVTARYFRLTVQRAKFDIDARLRGNVPPSFVEILDADVSTAAKVNLFEDKAGYGIYIDQPNSATPLVESANVVDPAKVLNISKAMQKDGTLDWTPPAGEWVVLRMGYSLTGKKNHPATPAATGFEVDKLSAEHVRRYMETYSGMVSGALGELYGKSFRNFLMDSWEAGRQNWTEDMIAEFTRRRGYDPTPWLPTLSGQIVGSPAQSDAFLWDFRRTIAEMLADNHYRLAKEFLAKQSIGLYAEAMGIALPTVGDGLLNKGQVSVPMGEFWTPRAGVADAPTREADVLETASAAHIYGRPIAATESFTSMPSTPGWGQSPFYLKGLADQNFARGINQVVFHTSDHQPFTDDKHKPGITLGYFGQHYSRNITWAEQAVAWNAYLARCSYMLQQGRPSADIAIFYGEGAPVTVPWWKKLTPPVPYGYAFDYLNSDVLLHQSSVVDGELALRAGPRYRVLVVPDEFTSLTFATLQQVVNLVRAGAVVVAPRTMGSPSLEDTARAEAMKGLVDALWGNEAAPSGSRQVGKGRIYWGMTLEAVLGAEHVAADLQHESAKVVQAYAYPLPDTKAEDIVWIHRHDVPGDVYFISNQRASFEDVSVSLRVAGKVPELWHPDTGKTEPVSYRSVNGRTVVDLHMAPLGSDFVVLRRSGPAAGTFVETSRKVLMELPERWAIGFPPNLGAPPETKIEHLASWTDSSDRGVRYFSGTATYAQDVRVSAAQLGAGRVLLDLGRVREIAEVSINGSAVGEVLWKPPFVVDVSRYLRAGSNRIEVKVTNLWPNRIIGDQQPDARQKYTFTVYGAYDSKAPLMESGLLGPVKLMQER